MGNRWPFSFFFFSYLLGDGVSDHRQQPVPICVGFKRNVVYVLSLSVKSVWEDFRESCACVCACVCVIFLWKRNHFNQETGLRRSDLKVTSAVCADVLFTRTRSSDASDWTRSALQA